MHHTHEHVYIPSSSGSGRTLLLLHGTGGDERSLLQLGGELDPQAALLGVRGNVLEGNMPRWFRRLAEGLFDEDDLRLRAAELAAFIPEALAAYGVDPAETTAVGYSNGANIAAALLLLHPGVLRSAVLLRPTLPLEPDSMPALAGARALLLAGEHDAYSPRQKVERLAELLRAGGAEVTLDWQAAGHELRMADITAARGWLKLL
jgi:predicted esterase